MNDTDFIEIDGKTDRDLLVATVTRLNTLTEGQKELVRELKKHNGYLRDNMKLSAKNAAWINAFKWIIGIGTVLLGTYLSGLW